MPTKAAPVDAPVRRPAAKPPAPQKPKVGLLRRLKERFRPAPPAAVDWERVTATDVSGAAKAQALLAQGPNAHHYVGLALRELPDLRSVLLLEWVRDFYRAYHDARSGHPGWQLPMLIVESDDLPSDIAARLGALGVVVLGQRAAAEGGPRTVDEYVRRVEATLAAVRAANPSSTLSSPRPEAGSGRSTVPDPRTHDGFRAHVLRSIPAAPEKSKRGIKRRPGDRSA